MKAEDLVTPTPNPAHRRSPVYALTDAGRALCSAMEATEAPALPRIAAALDEAEMRQVKAVLDRARRLVDEVRAEVDASPDAAQRR